MKLHIQLDVLVPTRSPEFNAEIDGRETDFREYLAKRRNLVSWTANISISCVAEGFPTPRVRMFTSNGRDANRERTLSESVGKASVPVSALAGHVLLLCSAANGFGAERTAQIEFSRVHGPLSLPPSFSLSLSHNTSIFYEI